VIEAFANNGFPIGSDSFIPIPSRPNKYLGNLALLAHQALQNAGIERIYGGDLCTYSDPKRFFSHRRDGVSGRFASLIWIQS
jgi:polyphenol oxidase